MNATLSQFFGWMARFSRRAAGLAIIAILLVRFFGFQIPISAQIVIALISLLIGIPHGAIDHLIAVPKVPRWRFTLYIVLYTAVAILAGWGIATWNRYGFIAIVLLSSVHFGFGDASFASEWRVAEGRPPYSRLLEVAYALPAGLLPVILPLTDSRALSALNRINPMLAHWSGTQTHLLRNAVVTITVAALVVMVVSRSWQLLTDLLLLAALSISAPPLIAFALYFGCWHALRHTARLVAKLPSAQQQVEEGSARGALWAAIRPGLYAVAGVLALAVGLLLLNPARFGSSLLWSSLVIVWALTVPHMATTAKFDLRSLRA